MIGHNQYKECTMKTTIPILTLVVLLSITGCASVSKEGISKPTIYTSPTSYLENFPLGSITEENLINHLGLPDKSTQLNGKSYYSYEVGSGYGERQYIYEVSGGIVTNVRYNDQGMYNGSSAKKIQNNKE